MATAFCITLMLVFAVAAFMINVVLPIYLVVKLVQWIKRYRATGELPWQVKSGTPAAKTGAGGLKAAFDREKSAAQRPAAASEAAEPAISAAVTPRPAAQDPAGSRTEEIYAGLKQQDRLERLALVYYVEDALKSGMTPEAVEAALKSKGWPEETIKAVLPQPA